MKLSALLVGFIIALGTVACVGSSATPSEPSATAPEEAAPTPTAVPAADSRCGGSLEGCFTYAEMDEYLDAVLPMVAEFFETQYPNVSGPRDVVYVPRGQVAASACGNYANSDSYEYCAANRTIYVGQDLIWTFYRRAGDAAPALGLAHEWGHHLQFMLDVPYPRSASQNVKLENQADCIAGAWAKYASDKGWLEDDDLEDVSALLQFIGSRESVNRDHGTTAERIAAFNLSFEGGIKACDSFFPSAPIA